ncbi:MAG: bifunctional phosphopantothenoylcysteine decarboxylase/phosphopantothenate--cysteine ligase CoaBC [Schleiferiaceae bacterium]
MSLLYKRKVLLGVSGSIAAYKSAFIVRELIKRGAEVQVVMTHAAKDFITPLTLSTLSKRPVYSEFIEDDQKAYGVWNNHVDMGLWADLMLIAPASSNTLSKIATGACDNLLSAVYLSAKCPVFVAPAMDLDMYANGATQDNLSTLSARGVHIIDSEEGELASGLEGKGRLAEPEHIVEAIEAEWAKSLPLTGKQVLINAGPTHEHIDPVRFIGNNSSGRMGVALAQAARKLGADTTLVLGPTDTALDLQGLNVIRTTSAEDMWLAMKESFANADLTICTAAVADFTTENQSVQKIKKGSESELIIKMVPTRDILASLGALKGKGQRLVGFALETQNGEEYAKGKLAKKNADAIVLNEMSKEGVGFHTKTNEVTVFLSDGTSKNYPLQSKEDLGGQLVQDFIHWFNL